MAKTGEKRCSVCGEYAGSFFRVDESEPLQQMVVCPQCQAKSDRQHQELLDAASAGAKQAKAAEKAAEKAAKSADTPSASAGSGGQAVDALAEKAGEVLVAAANTKGGRLSATYGSFPMRLFGSLFFPIGPAILIWGHRDCPWWSNPKFKLTYFLFCGPYWEWKLYSLRVDRILES